MPAKGKGGPKPKPTQLLKLQGTYRPHRHDVAADFQPPGDLRVREPPDDLTEAEKAVWIDRLSHVPPGLLATLDYDMFRGYVGLVVRRDEINRLHARQPSPILRSRFGDVTINPLYDQYLRVIDKMLKLQVEMGFTPSSRARMAMDGFTLTKPEPERNAWSRLGRFTIDGEKTAA